MGEEQRNKNGRQQRIVERKRLCDAVSTEEEEEEMEK
jgi:hypothetical protein